MTAPTDWKGLVRAFYPEATDAECETILTRLGAFPLCPEKEVNELLQQVERDYEYNQKVRARLDEMAVDVDRMWDELT